MEIPFDAIEVTNANLDVILFAKTGIGISKALESLEGYKIKGLDFYPPFDVGFLEEMDVEHLKRFVRLAQNSNFEVDGDIITTEFLKAKQNLGITSDSEYKSFARNAYIHLRTVLDELEKPLDWCPATLNPRYSTLIENESAIFESLFEVCEQEFTYMDWRVEWGVG